MTAITDTHDELSSAHYDRTKCIPHKIAASALKYAEDSFRRKESIVFNSQTLACACLLIAEVVDGEWQDYHQYKFL
jgi:hypothetical protein